MCLSLLALLVALSVGAICTPVAAQRALLPLAVGATSNTATSWPLFVADKQGFFAANGVKPTFINLGSAPANIQQLIGGSVDLGAVGSTFAVQATAGGAPIVIVYTQTAAVSDMVVGGKGITSLGQLRGKTIITGGVADISRIYTDTVLASAGLHGDDFTYTFAGGTTERFAALASGAVAAAIVTPPFSFKAMDEGYPLLAEVNKFMPAFPVNIFAANSHTVKAKGPAIVAFFKSWLQGVRWLDDPANRDAAIAILAERTNTDPSDAAKTYDYFRAAHIFSQTGITSPEGLARVDLAELTKLGVLKPPLPPASRFIDNTYVTQANAELKP